MKTSKYCNDRLNSGNIQRVHILGEIDELKDELSDVLYFTYCYIQQKLHINIPMIGANRTINKIEERITVWEKIFDEHDLIFSPKYLVNGSNHLKQVKIDKALDLARSEQK